MGRKRDKSFILPEIPIWDFLYRFTLIMGEINTGKTTLTKRILMTYLKEKGGHITVVDLAPEISPSDLRRRKIKGGIGGRLHVPTSETISYFHPSINPPRLMATSEQEAENLAADNVRTIEAIFKEALSKRSDALFINDCSLYLQAGDPEIMLEWIRTAETVVINGYLGQSLGEGRLSLKEREGMEFLKEECDVIICL